MNTTTKRVNNSGKKNIFLHKPNVSTGKPTVINQQENLMSIKKPVNIVTNTGNQLCQRHQIVITNILIT